MHKIQRIIIAVLLTVFTGLVLLKVVYFNYTPAVVLPETGYQVSIRMNCEGHGSAIRVRTILPVHNERQQIFAELPHTADFNFSIQKDNDNRFGYWQNTSVTGSKEFAYDFSVKTKKTQFNLPEKLAPENYSGPDAARYLEATDLIQTGSTEVVNALSGINITGNTDQITVVHAVYDFVTGEITNTNFSGKTDALTTLKLGKASCNGKSRLLVAMLRTLGIPSRLVGGIILTSGDKTVTHQWAEAKLAGYWVPLDPTNKHFAELPENYLIFYYGDEPFFRRTANINFHYQFNIEQKLYARETNFSGLAAHPLNIMNAWSLFQQSGLSLDLLRIILMIPIGAVVTIIFRNVIGIRTFGTFLPALIASAFRGSGLFWGMLTFTGIILIGAAIRSILDRLHITHTPKLTILLVFVVLSLLTISAMGVSLDNLDIARANIFPLALMAITIERFALTAEESGSREALTIFANTLITVFFCYIVINSFFLQTIVLAFPETLLLVICAGLYFGNWIGLRVTELIRFKDLIFKPEQGGSDAGQA